MTDDGVRGRRHDLLGFHRVVGDWSGGTDFGRGIFLIVTFVVVVAIVVADHVLDVHLLFGKEAPKDVVDGRVVQ